MGSAGDDQELLFDTLACHRFGNVFAGYAVSAIKFDTNHQPFAAHLADALILACYFIQPALDSRPQNFRTFSEFLVFEHGNCSKCSRTRHGITTECRTMPARFPMFANFSS